MTTASAAFAIPEVPPQATNSFRFGLFSTVNFQITPGHRRSCTRGPCGVARQPSVSLPRLRRVRTVRQLPTAYFIPKMGYKGFVLFGCSVRSALLLILANLPSLVFLLSAVQVKLMLTNVFLFN